MNRWCWKTVSLVITTIGTVWINSASAAPIYEITPLNLPQENFTYIYPTDINDQGQVVGWVEGAFVARGFSWMEGQYALLPPLPGSSYSYARAVNNLGQIIGSTQNQNGIPKAAFWSSQTAVAQELETSGGNSANAYATDINDDSQITGYYTTSGSGNVNAWEGVRWIRDDRGRFSPDDLPQPVLPPIGVYTAGYGINNTGQIVGSGPTSQPDTLQAALLWSPADVVHELDVIDPTYFVEFQAVEINNNGVAVGWATDSTARATPLRWDTDGNVTPLGFPLNSTDTQAVDINESGVIVGTAERWEAQGRAVVWIDGDWLELTSRIVGNSGWVLTGATSINESGQIVGVGLLDGVMTGYLLTPVDTMQGDFDQDGDVDGRDLLVLQRSGGQISDLLDWQANYGSLQLTASLAVPEASIFTMTLCGLGLGFVAVRH